MILEERIKQLNDKGTAEAPYVVYWMQSSQRAECNHALEYAISQANALEKPLLVYFGITDSFPEANERHYYFMLEGLKEVKAALSKRGIGMLIRHISPEKGALEMASFAALMVVDRGYLRVERQWRDLVAQKAACPVIQVETNVIVPVEAASPKEEYSAYTLRLKLNKQLERFILPLSERTVNQPSIQLELPFEEYEVEDIDKASAGLDYRQDGEAGAVLPRRDKPSEGNAGGFYRKQTVPVQRAEEPTRRRIHFRVEPLPSFRANFAAVHLRQVAFRGR